MWRNTGTCAFGDKCKFEHADKGIPNGHASHMQNSSSNDRPGDLDIQRQMTEALGMFQQMATNSVGTAQESRGSAAPTEVSRRTHQASGEEAGRLFVTQRPTRIEEGGGLQQSSDLYRSPHPEAIAREHRAACSQSATLQQKGPP